MPQTVTSYWKDIINDEDRITWTNALANLTLLSMRKNIQVSNDTFENKKIAYQDKDNVRSRFNLTLDIIQYDKWDTKELETRENILVVKINEKLDLFN